MVNFKARPDFDLEANHINYIQLLLASVGGGMPDSVHDMAVKAVAAADPADMSEPLLQMRGISLSHKDWLKQNERRLHAQKIRREFFTEYEYFYAVALMYRHFSMTTRDPWIVVVCRSMGKNGPIWNCCVGLV